MSGSPDSDPDFLARIAVTYLRPQRTEYDSHVGQLRGKTAGDAACLIVRRKVLDQIAEAYPLLAEECVRQMSEAERMAQAAKFQ